jgi:hypothetical protein
MIDTFQGDPAILITENGATLVFRGGQPVLDSGLENQAQISLFTEPDWPGNHLFSTDEEKIGSDFEETARGAITISRLALVEKSAEKSLDADLFGTVEAVATNPESWQTDVLINIQPPGADRDTILLTKNGQNWINQAANPAHGRL